MSALAHVIEAAGIRTIVLASMLDVVERAAPPRALFGNFPLGRPLGKPSDPDFQHDVLQRAFALLDAATGPVLDQHPQVIEADETPLSCAMPPAFDPSLPKSVDEARGLRKAYDRALEKRGVTSLGRVTDADGVPNLLDVLHQIAEGAHWKTDVQLPGGNTIAIVHDIRSYYEEAGLELVDGPPPGGRQAEAWFYEQTEAGKTVMAARQAIQAAEAAFPIWFYMAPGHR